MSLTEAIWKNVRRIVGPSNEGVDIKVRDVGGAKHDIRADEYGAKGDGTLHTVAERFGSLGAAQAFYGDYVTSLDDSLDWAAMKKAAAQCYPNGGNVLLPYGQYVTNKTLELKGGANLLLEGGMGKCLLSYTGPINTAAVVINSLYQSVIGNLYIYNPTGVRTGKIGLYIKGYPQPGNNGQGTVNTRFNNISLQGFESNLHIGNYSGLVAAAGAADSSDPDINTIRFDSLTSTHCDRAITEDGQNIIGLLFTNLYTGDVKYNHIRLKRSGDIQILNWQALVTETVGYPKVLIEGGSFDIRNVWSENSTDVPFLDASAYQTRTPSTLHNVRIADVYTGALTWSVRFGGASAFGRRQGGLLVLGGEYKGDIELVSPDIPGTAIGVDFSEGRSIKGTSLRNAIVAINSSDHQGDSVAVGLTNSGLAENHKVFTVNGKSRGESDYKPQHGYWGVGDRIEHNDPASSEPFFWHCSTAGAMTDGTVWAATTPYALNANGHKWIRTAGNKVLQLVTPGTSGGSMPNPSTIGEVITDGSCQWKYMHFTVAVLSDGPLRA